MTVIMAKQHKRGKKGNTDSAHNRNPSGNNQHWKSDEQEAVIAQALKDYHRQGITCNRTIAKLLEKEVDVTMCVKTVQRRLNKLGLFAAKGTMVRINEAEALQLVVNELDRDSSKHLGVKSIREKIIHNADTILSKAFAVHMMHLHDPDSFELLDPTAKKIYRTAKYPLGINHWWAANGHDKLYRIGFPIYAFVNDATSKILGAWVVPSNWIKDAVAYLYLSMVERYKVVLHYRSEGFISSKQHQATGNVEPDPSLTQKNLSSGACTAHESTISYRFPSSSGSPSPPPIVPSSPDLAHQNQPGPSDPYLALPPPEDEIPDLDELPSEQPPSPPPHTPAPTMSGHHRITLAANPPYFDGDKSKYLGFVDACTTYIGAYRSEFSQDETKILFVLSYLRNENGTSCAASRWAMNWKQHNFDGFQGLKAGVTSKNFLEEFQRAFGDSNAEQVAAARLMALRQNKRSFADYISDFEMLAADAGYNVVDTTDDKGEYKKGDQDNILIEFLERGLSSEIASRLYNTGVPLPKAYGAFKAWCINIEANALRDQLRKASYGHPTQRPPPQFRPQTAPVAPTPAPARPAANEPVPMEIDRTHARGRNIICYNCQQPGHIARNCPEPRKKRTFFNRATMLEEIENGDKDNEFLKEIAEKLREKGF
ncbi:unnamed protein product [Mycena citricolor]|uniref:CCHC-type domain-containing protein n=1 Tax=Mycena citricolor TaxID=2018698 RepID=A0AAD2K8C7_9AGAR|nr:unnamed protein product [Mycena citricolor]